MENNEAAEIEQEATNEMHPLMITEDIRSYLYETAKWTKFLSIVGFIITALMVLISLSVSSVMQSMSEMPAYQGLAGLNPGIITFVYLLVALVYFYPSFLMFKFSSSAKLAVLYGSQEDLSVAMSKMKSIFKFWGILTIVFIALYVLMVIGISVGAGIAA